MDKLKKWLPIVLTVAVIAVAAVWFLSSPLEHIADTNGPADFSLQTITDDQICSLDLGALNVGKSTSILGFPSL